MQHAGFKSPPANPTPKFWFPSPLCQQPWVVLLWWRYWIFPVTKMKIAFFFEEWNFYSTFPVNVLCPKASQALHNKLSKLSQCRRLVPSETSSFTLLSNPRGWDCTRLLFSMPKEGSETCGHIYFQVVISSSLSLETCVSNYGAFIILCHSIPSFSHTLQHGYSTFLMATLNIALLHVDLFLQGHLCKVQVGHALIVWPNCLHKTFWRNCTGCLLSLNSC